MRTYTCKDCHQEHAAGPSGPLPTRCPACRRRHRAGLERRRLSRSRLSVVPPIAEPPPAPADVPPGTEDDAAVPAAVVALPSGLASVVRANLDELLTTHPARETLVALAERLAEAADQPGVLVDARALAAVTRELRAVVGDLVGHERNDEDDDLFGDGAGPTVVPPVFPELADRIVAPGRED